MIWTIAFRLSIAAGVLMLAVHLYCFIRVSFIVFKRFGDDPGYDKFNWPYRNLATEGRLTPAEIALIKRAEWTRVATLIALVANTALYLFR